MELDLLRIRNLEELRVVAAKGAYGTMDRFLAPAYEAPMSQYIVWNPTSTLPPKVVHEDRAKAIQVAGRMAHENPGQTFYVCKLVNSASKPIPVSVTYQDLER